MKIIYKMLPYRSAFCQQKAKICAIILLTLSVLTMGDVFAQGITRAVGMGCKDTYHEFDIDEPGCTAIQWHISSTPSRTIEFAGPNYIELRWHDTGTATIGADCNCNGQIRWLSYEGHMDISEPVEPAVSITSSATLVCQASAGNVTYTAWPVNGGPSPYYYWRVNGATVGNGIGSTSNTFSLPMSAINNGDVIDVLMIPDAACAIPVQATSNSITMSLMDSFPLSISINAPLYRCAGTPWNTAVETTISDEDAIRFAWYINGYFEREGLGYNGGGGFTSTSVVAGNKITCKATYEGANCVTGSPAWSNELTVEPPTHQPMPPSMTLDIPSGNTAYCQGDNITFEASGGFLSNFQWMLNGDYVGTNSPYFTTNQFTTASVLTVRASQQAGECRTGGIASASSAGLGITVSSSPRPAPPVVANAEVCVGRPVSLQATVAPGAVDVNWYVVGSPGIAGQGLLYESSPQWSPGVFTHLAESVNAEGCTSVEKTSIAVTVTDNCDEQLNWVHSRSFDPGGLVSETRSYFDNAGNNIQDQLKSFANGRVFATQSLKDRYDRVVGSTLSAPLDYNDFKYNFLFMTNGSGKPYSYLEFDVLNNVYNPAPVNNTGAGTLGWFYSDNNTWEDHVASTRYPYTRSEFYQDGTGEIKRSAGAGDSHRLGAGHEVLSGTFPVFGELNDYLAKRTIALPGITHDGSLTNEAVQSVVRDQNGKYSISIADKSGNTVMTCRPGTATDNVLTITNEVTANGNPASFNYRPMTYFYILHDQPVSITGSTDFVVENIVTDERKAQGSTFAGSGGIWPAGFYRILLNNTASSITLTYTNYFLDVAYQYYDDAGRQKVSVSPNGYKAWITGTAYESIDKITYTYNHQGWLLTLNEPDAGKTRYVYRKDGKIRFSQNAQQKFNNRFSYTHYDALGRPVESGEYIGTRLTFINMDSTAFALSAMKGKLEDHYDDVDWASEEKTDWVLTQYDESGELKISDEVAYTQQFVRGAVSTTQNANIKTWYSYDEQGRVTWMAQKPAALNRTFVTQYTYDFSGNVLTAFSQSYTPEGVVSPFYHHYEYDADKRLNKVYTSIDGADKKLRATYAYYLHGPLKRIVLGDDVQGIDFVYNIQGWLTQINHPDKLQDPGGDGNDAFGMALDYYESAMSGLFPVTAQPGNGQDMLKIHHLPAEGLAAKTSTEVNGIAYLKKVIAEGITPNGNGEGTIERE